jgi:hypothetical protein
VPNWGVQIAQEYISSHLVALVRLYSKLIGNEGNVQKRKVQDFLLGSKFLIIGWCGIFLT